MYIFVLCHMTNMSYKLSISNIVSNGNLGYTNLDLCGSAYLKSMKFDQAVFPAAVSKPYFPRTSNSVFRSGEFVIAEAKSIDESFLSAHCYNYDLRKQKR